MSDLWGQDIALGSNGQAKVASNGELILTEDVDTGLQDIALRLFIRLGTLFYDLDFGSLISDWYYEDSTPLTRASFLSEVTMRIEDDPRVVTGSVKCKLVRWDENSMEVQAIWRFIGEDQPLNMILSMDKSLQELIISDGRHSEPLAWDSIHEE